MEFLSINGRQDLDISVTDRALNYGDGLFTTAKISQGKIELLAEHIQRLEQGCAQIFIEGVNFAWLQEHIIEVAKAFPLAVLKVVISAGAGGRGYSRTGVAHPNVIVSVHPYPTHYQHLQKVGINLGVANTMLGINPQLAGLKHLNRLEQVLVRKELDGRAEDDLLVLNIHQHIVETSSANIFYQVNNKWFTPDLKISGVNGIIRQRILKAQPDVVLSKDNVSALADVSAMFVCNCVFGITPVRCFNNTELDMQAVLSFKDSCLC